MLALFAEMERTFTAGRAAHTRAVAEAAGRPVAHPADKIDYARLLNGQGASYGEISAKTGIPKASLHRYLADADHTTASIVVAQGGVRLKSSHAERDLDRGHAAGGRGHIAGGLRKQVTALQGRDRGW